MSFWQEKNWGEMLVKSKQVEKIINLGDLLIEKRSIGFGKYGLFVLGVESIEKNKGVELINLCKKENCVFVQIETINSYNGTKNMLIKLDNFKSGYYKKFITPYTAIINLSTSEEEILSEMKPKGRYNIRLAEKKGIVVKEVEKTESNIKIFYDLLLQTTSRDKFSGNTFAYYKTFLETIPNSTLFIAYKDDVPISAGIFVFDENISIYYYGASTNDENYRNLMAPYLLQWTAIKKAKVIGSRYYDFLGIATPGDTNSSLLGVTDFKLKFTKGIVNVSDSYIWVNKKFIYFVLNLLRKLKNI
nr:peptidoglycan bridge formation glycyltransferase FemA/FemB family protein [Candidatus Gracilibacteria bacterium]